MLESTVNQSKIKIYVNVHKQKISISVIIISPTIYSLISESKLNLAFGPFRNIKIKNISFFDKIIPKANYKFSKTNIPKNYYVNEVKIAYLKQIEFYNKGNFLITWPKIQENDSELILNSTDIPFLKIDYEIYNSDKKKSNKIIFNENKSFFRF